MSCRVDTSLIAGACVVGNRGLGVLGSVLRATTGAGPDGQGYLYNDWEAGDDSKEFRGLIVAPPASGALTANEDGSFDFVTSTPGAYVFTYRLYVDGADLNVGTVDIFVGTVIPPPTPVPTLGDRLPIALGITLRGQLVVIG